MFAFLETLFKFANVSRESRSVRKIKLSEEAKAFIDSQPPKVQQKIVINIKKISSGMTDTALFKKLKGTEIWEMRTLFGGICYRLFSFWDTDEETLIIVTHGIVKKTPKVPLKEILKAETIRKNYFNNKQNEQ